MRYPHLAARIFNTPLLLHPQKLDAIIAGLGPRLLGAQAILEPAEPELAAELFTTRRGERTDAGYRMVDGVAVVHAGGALVHRSKLDAQSNYLLGYNDIAARLEDAMANPDAHAVLQVWDSPGGEAQGAFEYAQRAFDLRGKKPMWAVADGMAASAAFLGASAADQLAVTTTGYAGSIGVVMRHVDFSRMLANDGIAVTHIFAGAHKVDGNQFEPLPAGVRSDLQAEINTLYEMFVSAVAQHTGMSADAVRATEARTYMGQDAVGAGLAHRIATTDQLISELAGMRSRSYPAGSARSTTATQKGLSMSGNSPAADAISQAAQSGLTQADVDRARAEGRTEGIAQGRTEGAQAERERVSGILAHKDAVGKTDLAVTCITSGLSVEQAGAVLTAAPAVVEAVQGNAFAAAMAASGNPKVSGVEASADGQDEAQLAASIVANFRGARPATH